MENQEQQPITIDGIIADPFFFSCVEERLSAAIKNRLSRPEPKPGFKYKRDWYDRMSQAGLLSATFFCKNIKSIYEKTSTLNAECRSIIVHVCNKAVYDTLNEYEAIKHWQQNNNQ